MISACNKVRCQSKPRLFVDEGLQGIHPSAPLTLLSSVLAERVGCNESLAAPVEVQKQSLQLDFSEVDTFAE